MIRHGNKRTEGHTKEKENDTSEMWREPPADSVYSGGEEVQKNAMRSEDFILLYKS